MTDQRLPTDAPSDYGRGAGNPDESGGRYQMLQKLQRYQQNLVGSQLRHWAISALRKSWEAASGDEHGAALARSGQAGGGPRSPRAGLWLGLRLS